MNTKQHHKHELLANGDVCRVERCAECGTMYLHMGALSVRLTPAAFESACATLLIAL